MDHGLQVTDFWLLITGYRLRVTDFGLPLPSVSWAPSTQRWSHFTSEQFQYLLPRGKGAVHSKQELSAPLKILAGWFVDWGTYSPPGKRS